MRRLALFTVLFLGCGARFNNNFTPLANAARDGDVATVRTLIRNGADPNAIAGQNNWTPLMHAIHKGQIQSVEALLDGGADVNRIAGDGFTALMMAAGYGYTDIVQLLLQRGANPHLAGPDGVRPIDLAAAGVADIDRFTLFQCHEDTVRVLRNADPSMSLSPRALMWARAKRCHI